VTGGESEGEEGLRRGRGQVETGSRKKKSYHSTAICVHLEQKVKSELSKQQQRSEQIERGNGVQGGAIGMELLEKGRTEKSPDSATD